MENQLAYLKHKNVLLYYHKNILASFFLSKYFYKSPYQIFSFRSYGVRTYFPINISSHFSKTLFVLLNFLFFGLFKRVGVCDVSFAEKVPSFVFRKPRLELDLRQVCLYYNFPFRDSLRYFYYYRKLSRRLRDFVSFFFNRELGSVSFKFEYFENLPFYIFYYELRKLRTEYPVTLKDLDFLYSLTRRIFFTYFLHFNELTYRQKYFFFFTLTRFPFAK